ncbi:hypothetical protein B0H10DRAFT_2213413 [Mycena sp. CBHHK59/15]|nr:hypothetical protein B0H10DRAFT_2213413 [Mycena sp. CBHHK59/15]
MGKYEEPPGNPIGDARCRVMAAVHVIISIRECRGYSKNVLLLCVTSATGRGGTTNGTRELSVLVSMLPSTNDAAARCRLGRWVAVTAGHQPREEPFRPRSKSSSPSMLAAPILGARARLSSSRTRDGVERVEDARADHLRPSLGRRGVWCIPSAMLDAADAGPLVETQRAIALKICERTLQLLLLLGAAPSRCGRGTRPACATLTFPLTPLVIPLAPHTPRRRRQAGLARCLSCALQEVDVAIKNRQPVLRAPG